MQNCSLKDSAAKNVFCNSSWSYNCFLFFSSSSGSFFEFFGFFFVSSGLFHYSSEHINSLAHAGVKLLDHALDVVLQELAEAH
jgi:hypothetical protein